MDSDVWVRGRLARYKCSQAWVILDALPRNAWGKVLRRALRDKLEAAPIGAAV